MTRDIGAFIGCIGSCALIIGAAMTGSIVLAIVAVTVFLAGAYVEHRA